MPTQPLISVRGEHRSVPMVLRILWRYFVTGQQLRGPGDNATLFHHATVDYRARPYIRLTRRKWERLARRNAAVTVPLIMLALSWTDWMSVAAVLAYLAALACVATGWALDRGIRRIRTGRDAREWTDPAARVLCSLLGVRYTRKGGRAMIELPSGWGKGAVTAATERPAVLVHIPAGTPLDVRLKGRIAENVGARLGIPAPVQGEWLEAGDRVLVRLKAAPLPPKDVPWDAFARAMAGLDEDQVALGRKSGGHLVTASLSEDSPHFLMSGAAGTGKSVLARVFMVQRGIRGDGLIILDPKKFSHWRWAGGGKLPRDRVIYAYRDEDLHEAWLAIADEIRRRIELPEDELAGQRRVFIMVEEANVQTKKLIRYWRGVRKEIMTAAKLAQAEDMPYDPADLDPPVQSPAIVAMQESVCMGRELRIHVIVAAQRASANVFGGNGGDIRESFQGGRMVAKWDRKLWKMLVDTLAYVACPSGPRGIWGMARGEEFDIFRVPFLDEAMATQLMLDGPPVSGPVLGQQSGRRTVDGDVSRPAVAAGVTLAAALDSLPGQDGPAALSLDGLRTAAGRAGFPEPLPLPDGRPYGRTEPRLYALDALVSWRSSQLERRAIR